ncbi:hypothetical protein Sjap_008693 [Stephania japonica]|uniref:Uncharacterized protein n=1 Tax=Stephania japonica TaxID=461633 RepID=A0AAP0PCL1_9MAGN
MPKIHTSSLISNYKDTDKFDEACAICLETPTVGDTICHLPCLHKFHKDANGGAINCISKELQWASKEKRVVDDFDKEKSCSGIRQLMHINKDQKPAL